MGNAKMRLGLILSWLGAAISGTALAQGPEGPVRYQDQQVVRVAPETARQLSVALQLADGLWSERVGVGPIDIQLDRAEVELLRAIGLEPVVLVDDVQALIDRERAEIETVRRRQRVDRDPAELAWYETYRTLAEIETRLAGIAQSRPDLAAGSVIGQSIEGRDIRAVTITGPDGAGVPRSERPVVILNGCQHAREWVSPMTVMFLAEHLVERYDADGRVRALMDTTRFVLVPVVNPDGYVFSWTDQRLWRKNRRNNGDGTFGVDLNRNWSYQWGGAGSSGSGSSDVFRGAEPFSEPETQAVRDLAIGFGDRLLAHIDYHSYGQLILWPFGYADDAVTPEPFRTLFDRVSNDMAAAQIGSGGAPYLPIQSKDLYPAAGDSSDWFFGSRGVTSFTVELRDTGSFGFVLPADQIIPTGAESFAGLLTFAEAAAQPALLYLPDEPPVLVDADDTVTIRVAALDGLESIDPSSFELMSRVGAGTFSATPMASIGADRYEATLPDAGCGQTIEYYVAARTTAGSTLTLPRAGAAGPLATQVVELEVRFEDSAATDKGWSLGLPGDTAITGRWERGDPDGTAAQPGDDRSADDALCFVTGAAGTSVGDNDVDGGITSLLSPRLDLSGGGVGMLTFWLWYSNDAGNNPGTDSMPIHVSDDDGASWTLLDEITATTAGWEPRTYTLTDLVSGTDRVRLRFVARDLGGGSIVEAAVDDVRVFTVETCARTADLNGDGLYDFFDVSAFLGLFNGGDPAADFNDDGVLDFFDVSAFLALFNAQM